MLIELTSNELYVLCMLCTAAYSELILPEEQETALRLGDTLYKRWQDAL